MWFRGLESTGKKKTKDTQLINLKSAWKWQIYEQIGLDVKWGIHMNEIVNKTDFIDKGMVYHNDMTQLLLWKNKIWISWFPFCFPLHLD